MHFLPKILAHVKSLITHSGVSQHLSSPNMISHGTGDSALALSSLTVRVWGDAEKFWANLAFLLIAPTKTIQAEVAFGLTVVWAHPYQAHLSSLDEVAKKLTLLVNSGNN